MTTLLYYQNKYRPRAIKIVSKNNKNEQLLIGLRTALKKYPEGY